MQAIHQATEEAENQVDTLHVHTNAQVPAQLIIEGQRIITFGGNNVDEEDDIEDDEDSEMQAVNIYLDENIDEDDEFEDDEFDVDEIELPDDDSQPDSN